jgi:hypothetical protein
LVDQVFLQTFPYIGRIKIFEGYAYVKYALKTGHTNIWTNLVGLIFLQICYIFYTCLRENLTNMCKIWKIVFGGVGPGVDSFFRTKKNNVYK